MQNSTLLFWISLLTIVSNILSITGHSKFEQFVFRTYTKATQSSKYAQYKKLKDEQISINRERSLLSAQDNYAKWTKLNRKFDQLSEKLAAIESELNMNKVKVESTIKLALKFTTVVPITLMKVWYSRTSLFYIPQGVFPWFMNYFVINFPFMTKGSVGIFFWCFCLNRVFWCLYDILKFFFIDEKVEKPTKLNVDADSTTVSTKKTE
ncbi:hypothetical protein CANARDRAFT_234991 [[Candida] arabinofermentans NRRL YB-2248]|uniref:Golgi to ER traffic protein 1 n=1 Tax=[Candida] arabinofermentans NRRL YB-2248 TaxID=983967 RepID=A0A1E4T038_9ASCO|nr:hypothetical protein CANARDRAFT_234991 [[Candida] arabinofermentans NRRL YB-2248]